MKGWWGLEEAAASARVSVHWREVQRKQSRIEELNGQIRKLEREEREYAETADNSLNTESRRRTARREAEDLREKIGSKKREIASERQPPPPVLQPLPADRSKAMEVIFFLKMPRRFQALSRLSFMANQMLVPGGAITIPAADEGAPVQPLDISALIKKDAPKTSWDSYYTSGSSGGGRTAESTLVQLGSMDQVPKQIGGTDVTTYTSPSEGVWHPDDLDTRLFWDGGRGFTLDNRNGAFFDPFARLPLPAVTRWFTETLPADRSQMQWAMGATYGASRTRGNDALAFQQFRPPWLSSSEFLAAGALRAFPNQQFRKLCVTLSNRALPLGEPAMRALMLQTLFHVGDVDLSSARGAELAWWGDVDDEGLATLHSELGFLAEELKEKPSDHAALLLLAQVRVWGVGCGVSELRFRVQGSGFRVQGSGLRVEG